MFYTMGAWTAKPGQADAFVDAWQEFTSWGSAFAGARTMELVRDTGDDHSFVSFGEWASIEAAHAWKQSPEFGERMSRVQEHVAAFRPTEMEHVASSSDGSSHR